MNAIRMLAAMLCLMATTQVWAATYVFTGAAYDTVLDYTSCTTAPSLCANFPPTASVRLTFSTSIPLDPNLAGDDITALVTAYELTDGINTYSSTDPDSRVYVPFSVATDGNGQVTDINLLVQRWLTGASPHTDADRFSYVFLVGGTGVARNNLGCHTVAISPGGTPDACTVSSTDSSESRGIFSTPGVWSMVSASVSIPTLSPIALLLLASGIAAGAWRGVGSRKPRTR
jgi:hypothetical protein